MPLERDFLHSVLCSICKATVAPRGSALVLNSLQLLETQPWPQVFALETATLQNRLDFLSRGSVQTPSTRLGSRCGRNCICLLFFPGLGWDSVSLLESSALLSNCMDRRDVSVKEGSCVYYIHCYTPCDCVYRFLHSDILRYVFTQLQTEASRLVLQCM